MSTIDSTEVTAIPAGWYPDPMGDGDSRWWDGTAWTGHTAGGATARSDHRSAVATTLAADEHAASTTRELLPSTRPCPRCGTARVSGNFCSECGGSMTELAPTTIAEHLPRRVDTRRRGPSAWLVGPLGGMAGGLASLTLLTLTQNATTLSYPTMFGIRTAVAAGCAAAGSVGALAVARRRGDGPKPAAVAVAGVTAATMSGVVAMELMTHMTFGVKAVLGCVLVGLLYALTTTLMSGARRVGTAIGLGSIAGVLTGLAVFGGDWTNQYPLQYGQVGVPLALSCLVIGLGFGLATPAFDRRTVRPLPSAAPVGTMTSSSTNGFAVASLVLGIIGFSVLAIVFGGIGIHQTNRNPRQGGRGMAIAGLVLGIVWLLLVVVFYVALFTAANTV